MTPGSFRAGEGGHAWMGICMTTPKRKTLDDAAMSIAQKPLMAARHTIARRESRDRADEPTGFELWTRGETVPMGPWRGWVAGYVLRLALWLFRWASGYDLEHCRRESHQAQIVASCGILALRAIAQQCHQEIDNDDNDWHRDPFLCGMRAGRRAALSELESAAGYSFQDCVRRVLAK